MKVNMILFFLLLLNLINIKPTLNSYENSYYKKIRSLWEESMEYESRTDEEDNDSLKRCSYSNYKYFSFIISGDKVTFEHYINSGYAVSIIKLII